MSTSRSSNQNRAEWNKICRQALSEHIQSKLGILIEPAQVRLKTKDTDDPYIWKGVTEKYDPPQKNLSDLSVGRLFELSRGVGKFFEAVAKETSADCHTGGVPSKGTNLANRGLSFTDRIKELEESQKRTVSELDEQKEQAALQSRMRQQAEEEVIHLKAILQKAQRDREELEQRFHESRSEVDHFRRIAIRCYDGVSKIWPVLEEMKPEPPLQNHDLSFAVMSSESSPFSLSQW